MDRYVLSLPKSCKKRPVVENLPESNGNKRFIISRPTVKANKTTQMYIDLGQKSFNRPTSCNICGLLFVNDDLEDELRHKSYCKECTIIPSMILSSWDDGKDIVVSYNSAESKLAPGIKSLRDVAQRISQLIELDLGTTRQFIDDDDKPMYLYVMNKRVIAAIVAEEVNPSRAILVSCEEDISKVNIDAKENQLDSYGGKDSLQRIKATSCTPLLGIRIVWVFSAYRRQKIAHRLLDVVRRSFCFGQVFDLTQIAFSQPTSEGLSFAQKYCSSSSILCYG